LVISQGWNPGKENETETRTLKGCRSTEGYGRPMTNNQPPMTNKAWLPVPLLLAATVVLWIADPQASFESRAVVLLMNVFFAGLVSLCIASLAGGGFLAAGDPGLLLFGSGALAWGTVSVVSCALLNRSANVFITIHNLGMLLSALCYIGGLSWRGRVRWPAVWLVAGYAGTLVAVGLLTWAALAGHTPAFFIQGQGGTPLRQAVLAMTVALYAITSALMLRSHRRQPSSFLYWYGLGLALMAVGLAGVMLQSAHGGLLGWTGRGAQCLGGAYLFLAALSAAREAGYPRLSLATIEGLWLGDSPPAIRNHSLSWWAARYGMAVVAVAASYGFRVALKGLGGHDLAPYITFFPAIMATALLGGFGPGLLATTLSCLAADIWVLNACGMISLASPAERVGLTLFYITGALMSVIADIHQRIRSKAAAYDRQVAIDAGERKMRQALSVSRSFTFDWDPLTDRVERSDSCVPILGLSGDAAVTDTGKDYFQRIHPDDRDRFVQILRRLTPAAADYATEYRVLRADGSEVVLEEIGQAEFDAEGKIAHLIGVATNITERKRAEEESWKTAAELKAANAALDESRRATLNLMDDAIKAQEQAALLARFPAENPNPVMRISLDGTVLYRNPAAAEDPGWASGIGQPVPDALRSLIRLAAFSRQGMVADVELDQRVYSVAIALFPDEKYVNLYGYDVTERRHAEQAAARAKLEWERTFDSVPDLITILDPDQRIIRVNRAMAERLGMTPATCVGLLCNECVHDRSAPIASCPHQFTLADGQNHTMEMHDERLGGDFLISTSPIHDQDGKLLSIVHVARDITAQKRAEALEREALALDFASQTAMDILESMGEGVMLLDMAGRIMSVNPAMERMTGIPAGESVGRYIRELIAEVLMPRDRRLALEALSTALDGQLPEIPPLTLLSRTGRHLHAIISVSFVRGMENQSREIVVTLRDVSALHDARQELEANERKYRELVENANSIIMRVTPEHDITFFNEYAQAFFGYTETEVLGKSVFDTITPEVDSEGRDHRALLQDISAWPERHGSNENENIRKDGRRVWVHWANKAIRDRDGNVTEILCVGTDITERKRMLAQAVRYQHRLRELAKRLSSAEEQNRWRISRYIHDTIVQNLSLSHIRLGSLAQPLADAEMTEEVRKIYAIRTLLDEAIDECRMVMSDLTPALLYELGLIPALNGFARQLEKKHGTQVTIEDDGQELSLPPELRGLLFESVRELIMNALKHAGPCEIRVFSSCRDGMLAIRVTDNGKGFDPSAEEPATDSHGGFGTFSIRQRIEGLGGELEIASAPGKGTTATIRLPMEN